MCFGLGSPKSNFASRELHSTKLLVPHSVPVMDRSVLLFAGHQKTPHSGLPRWLSLGLQDWDAASFPFSASAPTVWPPSSSLTFRRELQLLYPTVLLLNTVWKKSKDPNLLWRSLLATFLGSHSSSVMRLWNCRLRTSFVSSFLLFAEISV